MGKLLFRSLFIVILLTLAFLVLYLTNLIVFDSFTHGLLFFGFLGLAFLVLFVYGDLEYSMGERNV